MSKASLNSKVISIAWPMMLSSASVPLLGMVDTALLGHLPSERFLAAVALGSMFISLMYWSFGFLRMGTTGLSAQARGRTQVDGNGAENQEGDAILFRAMVLAAALGLAVTLVVPLVLDQVLHIMKASEQIRPLAKEYIDIRRYSAPAVFISMAIAGYLIGNQRPKAALAVVLSTNISNIILDIWFIVFLGLESAGAAWATLIAEYLGLGLALLFAARYSNILRPSHWLGWLESAAFLAMLRFNYHLLVRTVLLMLVFNFFTAQGAAAGDKVLAANAILLQLVLFSAFVLDGFSFAAEALCGEAFGARNKRLLLQTIKYCRNWTMGAALLFVAAYSIAGANFVAIFSDITPVITIATNYLPWAILVTGIGFAAYLMDGIYIAIGRTAAMHASMWLATAVFIVTWMLTKPMGNHGLWLAYTAFILTRGVSLWISHHRWCKKLWVD